MHAARSLTSTTTEMVSPVPAPPVIVPSQSLLEIAAGECTRCGRPTELGNVWNICLSCVGEGSTSSSSGASLARCAACRVPFSVPSRSHTAHILCPPCQARHATLKPKPQRANPYPVVTPIAKSARTRPVALTTAYAYPQLPTVSPSPTSPLPLPSVGPDPTGGEVDADTSSHADRGDAPRKCMRLGCGARLSRNVLRDMCEVCGGGGFVRPPLVAVPKCIQRRAMERAFLHPPTSPNLVCDSLQRVATLATETENGEDELEIDLVYPDDFAFAAQCASTISESKSEASKPIDDEDAELELVYPEDPAEAAQASFSESQTKFALSTALRQLFRHGLQTIPILQDFTAHVDKSPPRRCRMPGCNQLLPTQTCMERCVKCSIDVWKRRKLAFMDTSYPSQLPNTTSPPMTDASMEEVTTMLDDISDFEGENDLQRSSTTIKSSNNGPTSNHGVRPITGWDSDLTELSSSDSESEGVSDSDSDLRPAKPHGDTTRLTIRIPLLFHRLPPDRLLRKCGNKRCNIALPKDHRWKTCDPCRRTQRMYQRIRLENKRRSTSGMEMLQLPDMPCRRWRSLSPDIREPDTTLTPETSRPCSARHCPRRIPLPEVYRWKTCAGCRANARREARRKRDALTETHQALCPPEVLPRFPAYQNQGELLSSFDAQLKGFVEGQIMYLRAKLHESETRGQREGTSRKLTTHVPMIFVFMGEYSVVTGQRGDCGKREHERASLGRDDLQSPDDPAASEAMRQEVSSIVLELERALRTTFRAGEAFAIDKGGLIMRFTCELELIAQLRPLTTAVGPSPSSTPDSEASVDKDKNIGEGPSRVDVSMAPSSPTRSSAVPLVKTFSGELEAVVVPDESHRLFRGRRAVVRYCMLG